MSPENVDVVRRFLEQLWDDGNMDAALAHLDAEVELDWSGSRAPYAGVVRGREAARRWFEGVREAFSEHVVERREITDMPPSSVAVEQTIKGTGRASGVEARAIGTTVWTLRDGKLVHGRLYQTKGRGPERRPPHGVTRRSRNARAPLLDSDRPWWA